jgi:hypothetical protein
MGAYCVCIFSLGSYIFFSFSFSILNSNCAKLELTVEPNMEKLELKIRQTEEKLEPKIRQTEENIELKIGPIEEQLELKIGPIEEQLELKVGPNSKSYICKSAFGECNLFCILNNCTLSFDGGKQKIHHIVCNFS